MDTLDPLQLYFNDTATHPLLTRDEERGLFAAYHASRDPADPFLPTSDDSRAAYHSLATHNQKLVIDTAAKSPYRAMSLDDRIAHGQKGLLRAIQLFDPSLGYRFSTYDVPQIAAAIQRAFRNDSLIHVPQWATCVWRNNTPQTADLPRLARQALAVSSLDVPLYDDDDTSLYDRVGLHHDPLATLSASDLSRDVAKLLNLVLDAREERILRLRFGLSGGDPLSLEEIGNRIGLTKERVRQLEKQALSKLRRHRLSGILAAYRGA